MNMERTTKLPSRALAIAEGLLVAAIWASSFVFVKVALTDMGPLTVAGLRYFLAFAVLLPFMLRGPKSARPVSRRLWIRLLAIGVSAYAIGNGALFWGLKYLPATTGSFMMSSVPLLVLFAGIVWLKEIPTWWQVVGLMITLVGGALFFSPGLESGEPLGIAIVSIGLFGFAAFGVLGRAVARDQQTDTLWLTAVPLAFGGGLLLLIALPLEGLPPLSGSAWAIVAWLAIVNTALAYILYNHSLQVLPALEMNVLLNLSPLGTAVLAWLFLQESLSRDQIIGIVIVIAGVMLVQRQRPRVHPEATG